MVKVGSDIEHCQDPEMYQGIEYVGSLSVNHSRPPR